MAVPRFLGKRLEFVVLGYPNGTGSMQGANTIGAVGYKNIVATAAKAAVQLQGWEVQPKSVGLYLVVVFYIRGHKHDKTPDTNIDALPANRQPPIDKYLTLLLKTLKGIVYEIDTQVVGILAIKRYISKRESPRTEVLVGIPADMKELLHDIRNS